MNIVIFNLITPSRITTNKTSHCSIRSQVLFSVPVCGWRFNPPAAYLTSHLKHLPNNLLQLAEGLGQCFPPLHLRKGFLNSSSFLIPIINTRNKKLKSQTQASSSSVDKAHKFNIHNTFIRRPGCLLDVLYRMN